MRKRYRIMFIAALVAALVVPVGFALSLDSGTRAPVPVTPTVIAASTVAAPLAVDRDVSRTLGDVPDTAKLLLVGASLFGLAAAVRKAA